jgi:hypothetical protein
MLAFEWTPWWETAAVWLEAVGTLLAFGVAFALLRKEQKARREYEGDRRRAQARLVAAWTTTPSTLGSRPDSPATFELITRNGSDEPVYAVLVSLLWTVLNLGYSGMVVAGGVAFEVTYTVLGPQSEERVTHSEAQTPAGLVRVEFTDSQGYRWRRGPRGDLELVDSPPATRRRSVKDRLDAFAKGQVEELDS